MQMTKKEQKYQVISEVFGQEIRLPTLYSFEGAMETVMAAEEALNRFGVKKNFFIVMAN